MPVFLGRWVLLSFDEGTPFPRCLAWPMDPVCVLLSFLKPLRKYPWFAWYSLIWQDMKLCWLLFNSLNIPLSIIWGCLPGCSPQFDPDKTLFYFCYRLFTDCFSWNWPVVSKSYLALPSSWILPSLVSLLGLIWMQDVCPKTRGSGCSEDAPSGHVLSTDLVLSLAMIPGGHWYSII